MPTATSRSPRHVGEAHGDQHIGDDLVRPRGALSASYVVANVESVLRAAYAMARRAHGCIRVFSVA